MWLLVNRCLKRSSLVQDLYESWQLDHQEAMLARDVEELCGECVELCQLCDHAWHALVKDLFAKGVGDSERVGRTFQTALKRSIDVAHRVLESVNGAERKGYQVNKAVASKKGLRCLQEIESKLSKDWPFLDGRMIEESRVAYARGDYLTAEELLHAARGLYPGQSGCQEEYARAEPMKRSQSGHGRSLSV